ncbi:MAG: hypothetical protein ACK4VK_01920 [Aquificaceae bacterium]
MGVLCLLLDKEEKYLHLLSDLFKVTGHELLIALNEEEALEFLKIHSPDIVLMPLEDIDFWIRILEEENYLPPIFLVEKPEGFESFKKFGFTDMNCISLPLNPIELFSNIVHLSRSIAKNYKLDRLGFVNILIKLLKSKKSLILSLESKEKTCDLYILNGSIKGSNCDKKEILWFVENKASVQLKAYKDLNPQYVFENNWDFFSMFMIEPLKRLITKGIYSENIDLKQPIELKEGFYWIGVESKKGLFQKNVYLRIYEKGDIKIPILINIGTLRDYPTIKSKLDKVVGSVDMIKGIILLGSEIDEASGIFGFLRTNSTASVITSMSIANRLRNSGVSQNRIRTIEALPGGRLKLATEENLKFIPIPFLPGVGDFMVLEEGKGYLFTGRFLSSLCSIEEFNPCKEADEEDVVFYASLNMPSQNLISTLLKKVESEKISSVYPMFGNPVFSKNALKEIFEKLGEISKSSPQIKKGIILEICENILISLEEYPEKAEIKPFLEEFNKFVYLESGKIMQSFIGIKDLPNLIVNLMLSMDINPRFVKDVIKKLYRAGVPLTI